MGTPHAILTGRRARHGALALAACLAAAGTASCGRADPPAGAPRALAVMALEDSGAAVRLRVAPPEDAAPPVRVWLARVSPRRAPPPDPPLPAAAPDSLVGAASLAAPPPLVVDADLRPPILRTPAALRVPHAARGRASVELDVRVDEEGRVTDALWAGGGDDSARVAAAIASALGMRFHPAERAGRPVAVWCRQRFDFAPPPR